MRVVATAGHVNHGKSALVTALTGQDPDRLPEERRRGLTVDLGHADTLLPDGEQLAIVDVPGHRRFLGNTLCGVATAPAVLFVVAADGGWQAQSFEHLAAVRAFGIRHGVLAVTRADLADPAETLVEAGDRLADAGLTFPGVAVSARSGQGLDMLRDTLAEVTAAIPTPPTDEPVRLWIDRAFTLPGPGTVVTGTLTAGRLHRGMTVTVAPGGQATTVRGLQCTGREVTEVAAPARVAVNLRRVAPADVGRGRALLSTDRWRCTDTVDIAVAAEDPLPREVIIHCGTAMTSARTRRLDGELYRLRLAGALPLRHGDRLLVRDTGRGGLLSARVWDIDPAALRRRGAAAAWARWLRATPGPADLVRRRGAVHRAALIAAGGEIAEDALRHGDWLVDPGHAERLAARVRVETQRRFEASPPEPGLSVTEAARLTGVVPDLVPLLVSVAGLELRSGRVVDPRRVLPARVAAVVAAVTGELAGATFAAPTARRLRELGATVELLMAAVRAGALWHGGGSVYLAPDAPDRAAGLLPTGINLTVGDCCRLWSTTRRVAVPLLEHLDARGLTRRDPDGRRVVTASASGAGSR